MAGRCGKAATGEDARVIRTRADVGRTALDVLVTEGSEAVTHARVAELAGYSKTTLYTHWPSRVDLLRIAVDAIGELPHTEPSGDLRADLIGELRSFRTAVVDLHLDKVLYAMAQWASIETMAEIRESLNTEAQRPVRTMLESVFEGPRLEAAISMLAGVVACPSLMFGTLPDDDVIEAAVDMVLANRKSKRARRDSNP
ncbi:TetR/AcrR family transcriptional regulator [Mycolicibacterium sp. 018/SC-01/001]|uniref:TetR/AcrR family transcriptional regulator n=1 Tax=Mycolicibacterium sp. 018/SC-01/001 TaxID=2592069 RepID=UPI0011801586|nr:TetR/AcrR family transcriptional regulator [Mycolicibacterium sp. 018/SC-01/001]TRW88851.1 TetR/AcrR family transcriptional regulator [Mycolicibacterium sp. 018/SC-01/001]